MHCHCISSVLFNIRYIEVDRQSTLRRSMVVQSPVTAINLQMVLQPNANVDLAASERRSE